MKDVSNVSATTAHSNFGIRIGSLQVIINFHKQGFILDRWRSERNRTFAQTDKSVSTDVQNSESRCGLNENEIHRQWE